VQYAVQYSTVHYSTIQSSVAQHSTAQCSAVQHSAAQHSTVQYSTVQSSTAQRSAVQCSAVNLDSRRVYGSTKWEYMFSSTHSWTSALDGVGRQRHAPTALPPRKRHFTLCVGGWVSFRGSPFFAENLAPHRVSIPGPFPYTDWAIAAHWHA